jgi:hypothetical protein
MLISPLKLEEGLRKLIGVWRRDYKGGRADKIWRNVNKLACKGYKMKMQTTLLELMANEVTINLVVLGLLIEDIIVGHIDNTKIVPEKRGSGGLKSTHIAVRSY